MTTEGTERRSEGFRPRPYDRLLLPGPPHASHDRTIIDLQTQVPKSNSRSISSFKP